MVYINDESLFRLKAVELFAGLVSRGWTGSSEIETIEQQAKWYQPVGSSVSEIVSDEIFAAEETGRGDWSLLAGTFCKALNSH